MVSVPNHPTECVVNMLIFRTTDYIRTCIWFWPHAIFSSRIVLYCHRDHVGKPWVAR